MSRKDREKRKIRSARDRAEKHVDGFSASSLSIPEGVSMFKLKKGVMFIDIIPYVVGKGNPFADEGEIHYERTYFNHKNIGPNGDSFICLKKTQGKPCPVCEYRAKLASDPDSDEDTIKEMGPKERQLFNVIDLKDQDKGIQLFESSYHLFGRLIDEAIKEPDEEAESEGWDKFHDPENGLTLKLTVVDSTFNGRTFQQVSRIDFRSRKKQYEESIIDDAHCLDEVLKIKSYDDLKKALLQGGGDDEADEDDKKIYHNPRSLGSKKSAPKEEAEEDEDEDELEEEEEKPLAKKPGLKKPVPKKEEEEDDEADDWDDEEEEEKKPASKKPSSKKVEEDEEEEDDEDLDEEEEEEEEKPAPKKPLAKAGKKKPADEEDEWED